MENDYAKNIVNGVGAVLKKLRKDRALSLEDAARLMDVSKLTLSKIERGDTNPTIGVLAKIAKGFEVPLMTLFLHDNRIHISRAGQTLKINDTQQAWSIEPIFEDSNNATQLYRIYIAANSVYEAAKHQSNTTEIITVMRGTLKMIVDGQPYLLQDFDSFSFRSDQKHSYRNDSDEVVVLHALIRYGV
ncbi:helix-turn-helix domain-containing protein [Kurthia sibirica]|uniref:helix-turn-helix domain-containing protein n=1 Tax=Kurthia sibirica TaxID=202750 RepID=UPI001172C00F|nr:XRE family transcriptional regulator [Kurthia sibirica]GEK34606.1 DNA-binding protein [Kurthia sibirica]